MDQVQYLGESQNVLYLVICKAFPFVLLQIKKPPNLNWIS